jgi:response regulator RpfG family c-di-GMP phosphodiesterase
LTNDLLGSLKAVAHARIGTIFGLARLAEYRDKETGAHLERIQEYTRMLAEERERKYLYPPGLSPWLMYMTLLQQSGFTRRPTPTKRLSILL